MGIELDNGRKVRLSGLIDRIDVAPVPLQEHAPALAQRQAYSSKQGQTAGSGPHPDPGLRSGSDSVPVPGPDSGPDSVPGPDSGPDPVPGPGSDNASSSGSGLGLVRVVDFKTGHMSLSLQDIYQGISYQLPVYLDRAIKLLSKPAAANMHIDGIGEKQEVGYILGGMFYFEVKRPMLDLKKTGRQVGDVDEELLSLMAMNGLFIGDEGLFKSTVDKEAAKKSTVIKGISFKSDGSFYKRVVAPSTEDFERLNKHVNDNIKELCGKLSEGDFSVMPYMRKNATPCGWCQYGGACGIELVAPGAAFRRLQRLDDAEVIRRLRQSAD